MVDKPLIFVNQKDASHIEPNIMSGTRLIKCRVW